METEIFYTTLKNYGIRIYDEEGLIYENYNKTIMNNEIKKEIEKVYEELKVKNKKNVKYKIYEAFATQLLLKSSSQSIIDNAYYDVYLQLK